MRKYIVFLMLLLFNLSYILAEEDSTFQAIKTYKGKTLKHKFYVYWGYNHAAFLKSNIRFQGPNYDFRLENVRAKERPTPFSLKGYFAIDKITIPQYDYRMGYYLTENIGISIGLDHMKYVVVADQTAKLTGTIDERASSKYAGVYNQKDVVLSDDFLDFEHTDGLNLVSLDIERLFRVASFSSNRFLLNAQIGGGGGPVIPRTDVKIFGVERDNRFHVAGWGADLKAGLRLDVLKHFFVQTEIRTGYIRLTDILLNNEEPQRAKQNIVFGEWYLVGGWVF